MDIGEVLDWLLAGIVAGALAGTLAPGRVSGSASAVLAGGVLGALLGGLCWMMFVDNGPSSFLGAALLGVLVALGTLHVLWQLPRRRRT